jgi:large subunit ribosomal protein L21
MQAVIKTGGKQYLVKEGDKLKVEKLEVKADASVSFPEVLLVDDKIGTPFVKGAKVEGKVLEQGRAKKVHILKFKRKNRYKVNKGHRQPFTEVEITKISL